MKILYIHGYLGKAFGNSWQILKKSLGMSLPEFTITSGSFSVTNPGKMRKEMDKYLKEDDYDYIVASSLGAFYAMQTFGQKKILINPAMPKDLRALRDMDPLAHPSLTDEFLEELEREKEIFFNEIKNEASLKETFFIFGDHDDVAHNKELIMKNYPKDHIFDANMGHILEESGADKVLEILNMLEKEQ